MSDTVPADAQGRPFDPYRDNPAPPVDSRKSLGPGYDWLMELLRQVGRPAAFMMCLCAGFFQILAPPEARLDEISFGLFIALLGAMCGIRTAELAMMRPGR